MVAAVTNGNKPIAFRYFLAGLTTDAILIGIVLLIVLGAAALSYEGRCFNPIGLDTFSSDCSFMSYLLQELLIVLLLAIYAWWIIIPLLLLPPLAGLIIGYYKSSKA